MGPAGDVFSSAFFSLPRVDRLEEGGLATSELKTTLPSLKLTASSPLKMDETGIRSGFLFGGFRPISQGDLVSFRQCTKKLGVATWISVNSIKVFSSCLKQPNLKENMRQSIFGFHFPKGK